MTKLNIQIDDEWFPDIQAKITNAIDLFRKLWKVVPFPLRTRSYIDDKDTTYIIDLQEMDASGNDCIWVWANHKGDYEVMNVYKFLLLFTRNAAKDAIDIRVIHNNMDSKFYSDHFARISNKTQGISSWKKVLLEYFLNCCG